MTTSSTAFGEAYVIENDGSRTAIPIGFADGKHSVPPHTYTRRVTAGVPRSRFKLHLGRRIFGIILTLVGLPLLILPGPGLLLIAAGLSLVLAP